MALRKPYWAWSRSSCPRKFAYPCQRLACGNPRRPLWAAAVVTLRRWWSGDGLPMRTAAIITQTVPPGGRVREPAQRVGNWRSVANIVRENSARPEVFARRLDCVWCAPTVKRRRYPTQKIDWVCCWLGGLSLALHPAPSLWRDPAAGGALCRAHRLNPMRQRAHPRG